MSFDFNLSFAALDKSQQDEYEGFLSADAKGSLSDEGVYAFGAFNDDKDELIGTAVFQHDKTARLLSIAVSDEYRKKGVGSAMVSRISEILSKAGSSEMECLIPESKEGEAQMKDAELFLRHCGFEPAGSFSDFSLSLSSAREKHELAAFIEDGTKEGFEEAPLPGSDEAALLMSFLPIEPEEGVLDYSPSFSTVYKKNGKINGCFLVSEEGDTFLVNMFHLMSRNLELLQAMAVRSLTAISERYSETTELRFIAVTDKADAVLKKLFPAESSGGRLTRYVLSFGSAVTGRPAGESKGKK